VLAAAVNFLQQVTHLYVEVNVTLRTPEFPRRSELPVR
jgi:hypothetical protein